MVGATCCTQTAQCAFNKYEYTTWVKNSLVCITLNSNIIPTFVNPMFDLHIFNFVRNRANNNTGSLCRAPISNFVKCSQQRSYNKTHKGHLDKPFQVLKYLFGNPLSKRRKLEYGARHIKKIYLLTFLVTWRKLGGVFAMYGSHWNTRKI
jgi:hypothetical protein